MRTRARIATLDFWQRYYCKFVFGLVNSDWFMPYFHKLNRFACIKTQKAQTQIHIHKYTNTGTPKHKTQGNIFATSLNSPHTIVGIRVCLMASAKLPKKQLTRLLVSPLIFESLTLTLALTNTHTQRFE